MIPILVKLKGNIRHPGSMDDDPVQITTIGTYAARGGITCVRYLESDELGLGEDVYTNLVIKDNRLVMTRRANGTETRLVFEPGKTHHSYYETPFGSFRVAVITQKLDYSTSEAGGKIDIKYTLHLNDAFSGENSLSLEYTPDA